MTRHLRPFTPQTTSKGEIFRLNGYTFGVDGSQVSVFKEGDEVSFGGLLERHDGRRLEPQISLEVLSDFTNEPLEWELSDKELSRLLVTSNFTKSNSSRPEAMGLLDATSGGRCSLSGSLSCKLLTGSFTSGGLASGLLGTGHVSICAKCGVL